MMEKAYDEYMNEIIGNSWKSDSKKFWSFVKSQKRESLGIPTLRKEGRTHVSDQQKAEALNSQFSGVFTRENSAQPLPDKGHSPYLPVQDLTINVNGVTKQLETLNINKASGPDEIPARILRNYAPQCSPILSNIMQQSYDTGELPQDWLRARIVAIHKNGTKSDPGNYRPVSITCICSKIMEHIILSRIAKHLAANKILIDNQHGFREKLSCETQLVEAIHDWARTIDKGCQTDVLLLDFSKAFDKVAHRKLLYKINHYGIRGKTKRWIQGFLTGRTQEVAVNGTSSTPTEVLSGVPQGSVLGPALFLLYINDITEGISSTIRLFADDSVIYRHIENEYDQHRLQEDLQRVFEWAKKWDMEFNLNKCTHLCVTLRRNPWPHTFNINQQAIPQKESCKYLGVTIKQDLNWNTHSEQVRAKASKSLGLVRRTLGACSREVKEAAYMTLVRPQLEYATCAWNPHTSRNSDIIESVQRQAARFVTHQYDRQASVTSMLDNLKWDTLQTRRTLHQAEMFYKVHRGLVNICMPRDITRTTRPLNRNFSQEEQHTYSHPSTRVDCYLYSMFPRAVQVWNRLPEEAVTASNVLQFRRAALPAIRQMLPPPTLKCL